MNDVGNFLLFDGLLALVVVLVVVAGIFMVLDVEEDYVADYGAAGDCLDLLSSMDVHGVNVLVALSEDSVEARGVVCDVLDGRSYVLSDLTLGRVLVSCGDSSGDVMVSSRVVGGHSYELKIFF